MNLASPAVAGASRAARLALAATSMAAAAGALVLGACYWSERAALRAGQDDVTYNWRPAPPSWRKLDDPGIERPGAVPAGSAELEDDEEVLGVEIGGRARAYRLKAMLDPRDHLVNDVLGDVPVSVSYCNATDCARAFAGPPGGGLLDVRQAGLKDGEMVLKVAGHYYLHRSGRPVDAGADARPIPYADAPLARTTWKSWQQQHPRTDVYLGPGTGRSP